MGGMLIRENPFRFSFTRQLSTRKFPFLVKLNNFFMLPTFSGYINRSALSNIYVFVSIEKKNSIHFVYKAYTVQATLKSYSVSCINSYGLCITSRLLFKMNVSHITWQRSNNMMLSYVFYIERILSYPTMSYRLCS